MSDRIPWGVRMSRPVIPLQPFGSKGFTLIEIAVVLAILGFMSLALVPFATSWFQPTNLSPEQELTLANRGLLEAVFQQRQPGFLTFDLDRNTMEYGLMDQDHPRPAEKFSYSGWRFSGVLVNAEWQRHGRWSHTVRPDGTAGSLQIEIVPSGLGPRRLELDGVTLRWNFAPPSL